MDIDFYCTSCGQPLVASEEHIGATIECPACRAATQVTPGVAGAGVGGPGAAPGRAGGSGAVHSRIAEIAPGPLDWAQPIAPAWRITISNFGVLIGPFLLYIVIQGVISWLPIAGGVAGLLVTGPLTAGWTMLCLKVVRGQQAGINDLFAGFAKFGVCLGAYLLMAILISLGMLALVIPGIIMSVGWTLTYLVIMDRDSGAWEGMAASWDMLSGYKWSMFGMSFLLVLINIAGLACLGVGLLFTIPLSTVATAVFYEKLRTGEVY